MANSEPNAATEDATNKNLEKDYDADLDSTLNNTDLDTSNTSVDSDYVINQVLEISTEQEEESVDVKETGDDNESTKTVVKEEIKKNIVIVEEDNHGLDIKEKTNDTEIVKGKVLIFLINLLYKFYT